MERDDSHGVRRLGVDPEDRIEPRRASSARTSTFRGRLRLRAELKTDPASVRIRYQLARVLFYAARRSAPPSECSRLMPVTVSAVLFGALISNKRDHAPADICVAEKYWLLSARNGRQAARVAICGFPELAVLTSCKRGADGRV